METMKDLFKSKKFLAALLSLIIQVVAYLMDIPEEQAAPMVHTLWLYIVGQGVADHGKESVRMDAKVKGIKI